MKRMIFLGYLFLLALFCTGTAYADDNQPQPVFSHDTILAKAQPDECFVDIGQPYPCSTQCVVSSVETCVNCITGYSQYAGPRPDLGGTCEKGQPKTNQTYVWGLTRSGNSLWFGTGPNVFCITIGDYLALTDSSLGPGLYVCEYGDSQPVQQGLVSSTKGDWRPPKIYQLDLTTNQLTDWTAKINDPLVKQTVGFRSAGSLKRSTTDPGVVFLAGGSTANGDINMFAFNATTKQYLGSHVFSKGGEIRKWVVVNNSLYTGMGVDTGKGKILRWYGTASPSSVWKFVAVGVVNGVPRELAQYTGADGQVRIATSAKGLWVSPPITLPQGLPQSSASWTLVWTPQNYEPDLITSYAYAGGSLYQFDGWLYWGTMHLPGRGAYLHETCTNPLYCFGQPQNAADQTTLINGTTRATSIWRARNLESIPQIQLLYGETQLPKFNSQKHTFVMAPTLCATITDSSSCTPLYGSSGFGNKNNGYTWEMQVAYGRLFVGTLDLSTDFTNAGADLWRFDSSSDSQGAHAENINGLDGTLDPARFYLTRPYGFRTMEVSADGNTLYCGMASYSNLGSYAGWELHQLSP
jgi:hypothetical protein